MCPMIKRLGRAFVSKHVAEPLKTLGRAFEDLREN